VHSCSSKNRLNIERRYVDGYSERTLAQIYGMSDSAIHRHVVGTDLNRLRQTDTKLNYLRVINAAEKKLAQGVTIRDGLRAAERLDKIRGLETDPRNTKDDTERLQVLLKERITFGIEGFKRGGVVRTRRDILEAFERIPETLGELYPLILDELDRTREPLSIEKDSPMQD
jgi:hypothetical protein